MCPQSFEQWCASERLCCRSLGAMEEAMTRISPDIQAGICGAWDVGEFDEASFAE